MPQIPTYDGPQVSTRVVKRPRAQVADKGAADIRTISKLTGIASNINQLVAQNKNRINTTEAEDTLVNFERAKNDLFFNPDTGYFNTQGRTAYDLAPNMENNLQELAKTHADGMANPDSREMFLKVATQHITSGQNDIMRHASKGLQAWEVSTIKAQVENTIESASLLRTDNKKLSVQLELGRQAVRDAAKLEGDTGVSLNEKLQTYDAAFAGAVIGSSINDNSESGQTALDKYGDMLEGDSKQQFEGKIQKRKELEKTQSDSQEAVVTANRIVSEYGDDRVKVLEAVSKIEDPEIQSKARKEAMYQVNQIEQAKTEERAQTFESAQSFVEDQGSVETYKARFPTEWEKLSPKQQKTLEKGEAITQDWNVWHDFMMLSDEEIRKIKPKELEAGAMRLDSSHRDKLYTKWRNARDGKTISSASQYGRTKAAQTKSAVEQLMDKKSSKWSIDNKARADKFYALVDSEVNALEQSTGKKITSKEYTDLLDNLTRKVTIEKDFWFDADVGIGDIPEEHLDSLTEALRNRNIPITSTNLVKAYEQAK